MSCKSPHPISDLTFSRPPRSSFLDSEPPERLLKTYKYILAFDGYTGNGGGDGDDDDGDPDPSDNRVLKRRLDGAHVAGHAVGNLSVQIVQDWERKGWYELFNNRMSEKPNLRQDKVCHSGGPLSPLHSRSSSHVEVSDPDSDDGSMKKYLTARPAARARHSLSADATDHFTNSASYLKSRTSADQLHLDLLVKREDRESTSQDIQRDLQEREARSREAHMEIAQQREVQEAEEARERKVLEEKKFKVMLAQTLLHHEDEEIKAAAKNSILQELMD
ncbi:hypothetical protein JB92DRAFT_2836563 [Gautieria morchelliformis]|nr:hypothetical protein JB92DRAFT_2836563 [Gautieria morchelliformis]